MSVTKASARCFSPAVVLLALGILGADATAQTPTRRDPNLVRLEREIARLATAAGGVMGVAAIHIESGRAVYLNRSERFPMASSYKVPIAVELLTRADRGEIRLDSMITLQPADLHPGSGTLSELFDDPGVSLSIRNLLELMLLISDNSATDVMLRTAGGAGRVTSRMQALGVTDVRVDRPTIGLIADFVGIRELPPDSLLNPSTYRAAARQVPAETRQQAATAFSLDVRDTATPEGMAQLLLKIWRGQALSAPSTKLLLDIMTRSTTGTGRIKGMLPGGTAVAHKTGTIGGTTNDVGIITLPDSAGHVVTVIFVKGSTEPV